MNKLHSSFCILAHVLYGIDHHVHSNIQFDLALDLIPFMILIFPNFFSHSLPFCYASFLTFILAVFALYMSQIK